MKKLSEGMFTHFAKFFPQTAPASITTNQFIQNKQYIMYVSVWNYGQRSVTITIMKGDKTVWENKSNNSNSLISDLGKANHMLRSIGLNPESVRVIKKLNGKIIEDTLESVDLDEARRPGKFDSTPVPTRHGLKVGDQNDLGNGKIEIILPRNDLTKRKELLTPLIDDGYKMVNTVKNMKMDIVTLKKINEETEELDEYVMDYQQRRKRGMIMRRYKERIKQARIRKAKRLATVDQLKIRARKLAIKILRRKLAGQIGVDYANLSPSQKMMIDAKVQKKKNVIGRIAKKILPRVRKMEIDRFRSRQQHKHDDNKTKHSMTTKARVDINTEA